MDRCDFTGAIWPVSLLKYEVNMHQLAFNLKLLESKFSELPETYVFMNQNSNDS